MDSWGARIAAVEGSHFRAEEKTAVERHLRKLVTEGKLPPSALNSLLEGSGAGSSTSLDPFSGVSTVTRGRPESEFVYQHVKGRIPVSNLPSMKGWGLGSSVSLGSGRWSVDGVSIFNVEEGKKMASTPAKRQPSTFELKRAESVRRLAADTPLVMGYRLYPSMTPARALLWGTIAACAGTAIGAKLAMIALEIKELDDVAVRMKAVLHPFSEYLASAVEPWKGVISSATQQAASETSTAALLGKRLKQNFQEH